MSKKAGTKEHNATVIFKLKSIYGSYLEKSVIQNLKENELVDRVDEVTNAKNGEIISSIVTCVSKAIYTSEDDLMRTIQYLGETIIGELSNGDPNYELELSFEKVFFQ